MRWKLTSVEWLIDESVHRERSVLKATFTEVNVTPYFCDICETVIRGLRRDFFSIIHTVRICVTSSMILTYSRSYFRREFLSNRLKVRSTSFNFVALNFDRFAKICCSISLKSAPPTFKRGIKYFYLLFKGYS